MTVTAHWFNNDPTTQIVYVEFIGAWTWDEFWNCIDNELDPLLLSRPDKSCTICDIRKGPNLPIDVIKQASKMLKGGTKWDLTVVVGNSQFAKMVVGMLSRLLPNLSKSMAMTTSLEDAERLIAITARHLQKFKKRGLSLMPVTANWLDNNPDGKIIYIKYSGAWTWDEFVDSIDNEVVPMLSSLPDGSGCMINDILDSQRLPTNAVDQATRVLRRITNWDTAVIVGTSQFIRSVVNMMRRIFPKLNDQVAIAASVAEAKRIIEVHRARNA